jgi:UDP-3-O-[3-hydroxymyristoyl] glucosamine N-acyltransferase
VVLIPESLADLCERYPQNTYVVVQDIVNSVMDVQDFFYGGESMTGYEGIAATANIDESAKIGRHAYIGEYVCIGKNVIIADKTKVMHDTSILDNVAIGSGTLIYPGVCIYKGCQIGNDCIIHSGARIGVDGFRFEQDIEQKRVRKMIHVGRVVIGDRVEIGANTAIDRATFEGDATIISDDVKIDNLVHIAHNARIGARTLIVTQTCVGGSATIGEDVWIGIGAAISDNVSIGNRAKVLLNAVVPYDVPEGEVVSGFYAMPHRRWKEVYRKLRDEI